MNNQPTLYLNHFYDSNGKEFIKFIVKKEHYHTVSPLFKAVSWISYNEEARAYTCENKEGFIDLISKHFEGFYINKDFLTPEHLRFKAKQLNADASIKWRNQKKYLKVTLVPGIVQEKEVVLIKANYLGDLIKELKQINGFTYQNGNYFIPFELQTINDFVSRAIFFCEVGISSMLNIADSEVQYLLLAQRFLRKNELCCSKEFVDRMRLKNYSPSTIRTYFHCNSIFINFREGLKQEQYKMAPELFLNELISRGKKAKTVNQYVNALRLFYSLEYDKDVNLNQLRPKKEKSLPKVLSTDEVRLILENTENLKHYCLLLTAYSAGLRVSEVVNLQLTDINSDEFTIRINKGKGKKDRITLLSKRLLEKLRAYVKEYRPTLWLFEGQFGDKYTTASAGKVFKAALKKAKLPDHFTFHSLRHSFATHLLNNGNNLRQVQTLLGHNNIKTTEIYTYVSNENIKGIQSPGDLL